MHLVVDGTEVGTGTAVSGQTAGTGALTLGARPAASQSAGGAIRILGVAGGNATITPEEITQARLDGLSIGDITEIPGKTSFLISPKQATAAVESLVDSLGANVLTRVGSPSYVTGMT